MPLFILNNLPFVWLGLAVILIIIESLTMGLTTVWFALGALVSMLLAFFRIPIPWQILIFLVISLILLIFTRPVAVKKLKIGQERTNSDALVGKEGTVVQEITLDEKGKVKVKGQIWTAASSDDRPVALGSRIRVEEIRGVTMLVSPLSEPQS